MAKKQTPEQIAAAKKKAANEARRAAGQTSTGGKPAKGKKAAAAAEVSEYEKANKGDFLKGVADYGSKTKGLTIGDPRQIAASKISDSTLINPSVVKMGDAAGANAATIASLNKFGGAQMDTGLSAEARGRQMGLASQLEAQALGQGPSLAGLQLKDALDRNIAQQSAMANSVSGSGRALAQRRAAMGAATLGQDAARQSAMARMAEQMNAQKLLGDTLSGVRTSDITQSTNQADLLNKAGVAGMEQENAANIAQGQLSNQIAAQNAVEANKRQAQQATLNEDVAAKNQAALNAQAIEQARLAQEANVYNQGAYNAANTEQLNANVGLEGTRISGENQIKSAGVSAGGQISSTRLQTDVERARLEAEKRQQEIANANAQKEFELKEKLANAGIDRGKREDLGSSLSAAGDLLAAGTAAYGAYQASDKTQKTNIKPGDKNIKQFLDAVKAQEFQYKGESDKHTGVMAQDLEKTEVGSQMVKDTPEGKMIDFGHGFATLLAAQSELNKRLSQLEKRKAA